MRRSKVGKCRRAVGEEIQQVPLRHERDELATRGQVAEIGDRESSAADVEADGGPPGGES